MIIVPGRCAKCPARIVSGQSVGDLYEEIDCRTSEGSTVVIGVCRDCAIDQKDIPDLSRAFLESMKSSGFKGVGEIVEILRRRSIREVLKEVQSERCMNCDEVLAKDFGITQGRIVHLTCPGAIKTDHEVPAGRNLTVRNANKVIQKGRRESPLAQGRHNVRSKGTGEA